MNPLTGTPAQPSTAEGLVPSPNGYGYVAPSEAPMVRPAVSTPPAPDKPPQAPSKAPETHSEPLIEFITDEPAAESESAALEPEPATAQLFLSPLLPNIGTSTMARLLHLSETPLTEELPDTAKRLVVIDASEKGIAAVTAHIEDLKAHTPHSPGSVTHVPGLDGIMVIPTGRGRLPRSVRLRLKILSGAHPVLMCPWVPALAGRLCDDAALEQIAASKPVASAMKKLNAQMEALTGTISS